MEQPKVSVIIPAQQGPDRLCLNSLLAQSFRDFEILCLCGAVAEELAEAAQRDSRIRVLSGAYSCGAEAADRGLDEARGSYVLVLRGSETAAKDMLERSLARSEETGAQITAFCGHAHSRVGNPKNDDADGYNRKLIPIAPRCISREERPDSWLSLLKEDLSFLLIRADLIRQYGIRVPRLRSRWQMPFVTLCLAQAQRIGLLDRRLITTPAADTGTDARDVLKAMDLLQAQTGGVSRQALLRRLVEYGADAFRRSTFDFSSDEAKLLYTGLQERFASALFDNLDRNNLTDKDRCVLETVTATTYEQMRQRCGVPMAVSFTSFPKRISYTVSVIENVRRQTRKADKVLLYLAAEQFPGKDADLPEALLDLAKQDSVQIRWVRDVRSHKKYHYVMAEYPDSLIVTLDDDLQYPDDMLENLFNCYLCHPDKVSAMRAHLTVADQSAGLLLPYSRWVKEYRCATYVPSPQLFFTSGAGTLFPPGVLHPLTLDLDRAWSLCPYADDVWLNIMTLLNGRCAVLAVDDFTMKNMPGSQEEALQSINVDGNQNDIQYDRTRSWLRETFGADVVWDALVAGDSAVGCKTVWQLSDQYQVLEETRKQLQNKLHQFWRDKFNAEQEKTRVQQEKTRVQQEITRCEGEIVRCEEEINGLQAEVDRLKQELAAERRSFLALRKIRSGIRMLRSKGVGQTAKAVIRKILKK